MDDIVKEQIRAIRESGKTDMLDLEAVMKAAFDRQFFALACLLEFHLVMYIHFILYGGGEN